MIDKLGVQLFTIRDCMKDLDSLKASFEKLSRLGYTNAQTAGIPVPVKDFAQAAKDSGIEICGTHYSFEEIRDTPDKAMEAHKILGTTNMGVGGMPGEYERTEAGVKRFIEDANKIGQYISKYGFKFTYHNHSFEFRRAGDKTIMELLFEGLDPKTTSFVMDTYWVQHGGGDVCAWIKKLSGRIDILHLKDMGMADTQFITEIGQGNINFDGAIAAAEETGVKYYVVEQDTCPGDPFDSLRISADYIRKRYMK